MKESTIKETRSRNFSLNYLFSCIRLSSTEILIMLCNREQAGEKVFILECITTTFRWLLMAFAIIARFSNRQIKHSSPRATYGGNLSPKFATLSSEALTLPLSQNFNRFSVIISSLVVSGREEVKIFLHQIKITFKISLCYFCRRFSTWYFLWHIN